MQVSQESLRLARDEVHLVQSSDEVVLLEEVFCEGVLAGGEGLEVGGVFQCLLPEEEVVETEGGQPGVDVLA